MAHRARTFRSRTIRDDGGMGKAVRPGDARRGTDAAGLDDGGGARESDGRDECRRRAGAGTLPRFRHERDQALAVP